MPSPRADVKITQKTLIPLDDDALDRVHGAGFFSDIGAIAGLVAGPGGGVAGYIIGRGLDNPDPAY